MKFFSITTFATLLLSSNLASAVPTPDDPNCPFGGNWNYCDIDDTYTVCVGGVPKWFSCTGGCQPICPPEGGSCTPRCDNGIPTSPPPGAEKRKRSWVGEGPAR